MERILVSWIDRNNDPYSRNRLMEYFLDEEGNRVEGPALSLMFFAESAYQNTFSKAIFFYLQPEQEREPSSSSIAKALQAEIAKINPKIDVELRPWNHDNPTEHKAIFAFLRKQLPDIRRQHPDASLVVNVSSGTPSMHTIWVLMAETGFIKAPFEVVQIQRIRSRRFVRPIEIGIETFYHVYEKKRAHFPIAKQGIFWDPKRFVSKRLNQLYQEAQRFARLNIPILLLGERGTGKTTLASWIRYHSPFRLPKQDADWPSVACGMYSPETMRAELFGYQKGAFTGADHDHPGLLAQAHQDTLFLDEISDVSRDLQRLLIRALEEKRYVPLGATSPMTSQFRLLTASNKSQRDLETILDPDFLDRIGMLTLSLPSLREIPEELPWLWQQVYQQALLRSQAQPLSTPDETFQHALIEHLQTQPLPGNLRDLQRVAYRLLAYLSDPTQAFSHDECLDYITRSLSHATPREPAPEHHTPAQQICHAFANQQPLPSPLGTPEHQIDTKALLNELKGFLAQEIRKQARIQQCSPADLCDVTERSLLKWLPK